MAIQVFLSNNQKRHASLLSIRRSARLVRVSELAVTIEFAPKIPTTLLKKQWDWTLNILPN